MKEVCVLGLGYVGLPTASIIATKEIKVHGIDINPLVVESINNGNIDINEPGLKTLIQTGINSRNLRAYTTPKEADVFIIAVPTPINDEKKADISHIENAAESIVDKIKSGNLIILESTSPPGTTKKILIPILEKSGLKAGEDIFVAYCPERVLPGNIIEELIHNTRIIGGINKKSAEMAKELYEIFVKADIHLTDVSTAEMVKLMENTYRDVNIALANELLKIAHHSDFNVWEVIKYANMHPRVNIHSPGGGVGGHCIPVDPWFIVEKFPLTSRIISQARKINDEMPEFTYKVLLKRLKQNNIKKAKISLLGVAYKANISDTRESPALKIIELIKNNPDLSLSIYDPYVKDFKYELSNLEYALKDSDCILVYTDHPEFKNISPKQISKLVKTKLIIDTKNALNAETWKENGFKYILLGTNKNINT